MTITTDLQISEVKSLAPLNAREALIDEVWRGLRKPTIPGAVDALRSRGFTSFRVHHNRTESSYKFTRKTLGALLDDAGFTIEKTWTDPRQWYALTLAGLQ